MKKKLCLLFIPTILFILSSCRKGDLELRDSMLASDPSINKSCGTSQFSKAYGGTNHDLFSAFTKSSDGEYVVVGVTYSGEIKQNHGMGDVWVFKIDKTGNLLWQRTLGGSNADYGWSIITT